MQWAMQGSKLSLTPNRSSGCYVIRYVLLWLPLVIYHLIPTALAHQIRLDAFVFDLCAEIRHEYIIRICYDGYISSKCRLRKIQMSFTVQGEL